MSVQCTYPVSTITVYMNTHALASRIQQTFHFAYIIIGFLFLVGILYAFLSTYFAYRPLRLFAKNLHAEISDSDKKESDYLNLNYAAQLFHSIQQENDHLLKKVQYYQHNIQNALLRSSIQTSQMSSDELRQMDSLFDENLPCSIFVLHVSCSCLQNDISSHLLANIRSFLGENTVIMPMQVDTPQKVLLIGVPPTRPDEPPLSSQYLQAQFQSMDLEYNCQSSLSSITENPMDIFRLYEEALHNAQHLHNDTLYTMLDDLEQCFLERNYTDAAMLIDTIFSDLEHSSYMNYFIQNILIVMLNLMMQAFVHASIPYKRYHNTYYEALYLCRSGEYTDSKRQIKKTFSSLLTILTSQETAEPLTKKTFLQYISTEFCNSSFSIVQLGDHFRVSGSYISYWFKKNFDENLSDYLWKMRLEYAQKLMADPTIAMNDIATMVGYDNYSSFRRKFKSHCGISPSEYRKQHFHL